MTRRAGVVALFVILAIFLVAALHLRQRDAQLQTAGTGVPAEPADAAAEAVAPELAPADVPATTSTPLPADDAPLSLIANTLEARAVAGDRKAACRLGIELVRCQQLELMNSHDTWKNLLPAEGGDAVQIAQREGTLRLLEQCQAVPASLRAQGARYLRQAALAGEPEAMLRYVNGEHFPLDARGLFADPQFDVWRREAPSILERAFNAGVPEAAMLMMSAYDEDYGLLSGLVEDDPARATALRLLMARLHGWQPPSLDARRVDAATMMRARAEADTWHREQFGGRRLRNRAMLHSAYWPRYDGSPHSFCRDP